MTCKYCGHQNDENSKFCVFCGQELERNEFKENATSETQYVEEINETVSMIDTKTKTVSIISICVYFFIFYFLVSILSSISLGVVLKINNIVIPEGVDLSDYLLENFPNIYYNFLATMNVVIYLIVLVVAVPLLSRYLKNDFKEAIKTPGSFWKNFGIGLAILYGASYASSIFIEIVTNMLKTLPEFKDISTTSGNQSAINDLLSSGIYPMIVIIIMTTILAPVLEELIFRKCFFNLSKKKGMFIVILSGAIFGSIHTVESVLNIMMDIANNVEGVSYANIIMELLNFVSYFASGIALGYIYKRSKYNIWDTILVHSAYNFIGVIATILLMFLGL